MKFTKLASICGGVLLLAISAAAQGTSSQITSLEFQTPKNGMTKQYEEARKTKAAWHKQQKGAETLFVLQVLTGEHTGSYIIGESAPHWADFDKPSIPDAADEEEYNKVIGPYVEHRTTSYFESMPKVSNAGPGGAKYTAVSTFHIKYAHNDDFRSAIARIYDARQKTNSPLHFQWEHLVNGGPGGTYVLLVDHANWASFDDDPSVKPLRDILRDAFGEQEAMSIIERLNSSIESTYSEIVEFRADLSYIPGK
jgi:hypothetical protein